MLQFLAAVAVTADVGALGPNHGLEVWPKTGQVMVRLIRGHRALGSANREPYGYRLPPCPCVQGVLHRLANKPLRQVGAEELALKRVLVGL